MRNKQCISEKERKLLKGYVHFMAGFEESSLYEDYKEDSYSQEKPGFSDEEFGKAFDLIRTLSKEGRIC